MPVGAGEDNTGSAPMFAIFLLSIFSIVLIPYTLWRLCSGGGEDEEVVKTWASKGSAKREGLGARLRRRVDIKLVALWALYLALVWYVQSQQSIQPFDPFAILGVDPEADDKEIRRAYRKLSLQYHPDKNPDPAAGEYFANYIAKAYKALTDEAARENYAKYGHPDGQQAFSVSVALPEWVLSKEKAHAPLILLVMLLGGIIAPLSLAAWYLTRTQKFLGPNQLMQETFQIFADPKYGIKESQGVTKVLDTLVCAMEFIALPITPDQAPGLEEARRVVLRLQPELRDKGLFWKRNMAVLKAHMLLLVHTAREPIPPSLQKDATFILTKCPALLQEMFGIATIPRMLPGYGWLTPAVSCVEAMQCIVQAVPPASKKQGSLAKSAESPAALLQLPHFDQDVLKRLGRKKVKSLPELQQLDAAERKTLLLGCGMSTPQVEDVETMLSAMPTVWVTAQCMLDGTESEGEPIFPEDILSCRIQVMLTRACHMALSFDSNAIKGKAAQAYAPHFPAPKEESWYFLVVDPSSNALLGSVRKSLLQAEAIGARYAAHWAAKTTKAAVARIDGAAAGERNPLLVGTRFDPFTPGGAEVDTLDSSIEELGQTIEVKFLAPLKPGRHELQVLALPDSWVGCDRVTPLRVKVEVATRADREGRGRRGAAPLQRSTESEALNGGGRGGGGDSEASDAVDYSGDEEDEDEEEEGDYDSEEYGTEESGEEGEDGPKEL